MIPYFLHFNIDLARLYDIIRAITTYSPKSKYEYRTSEEVTTFYKCFIIPRIRYPT